jgi:pilus assembly protein CpaF
LIIHQDRMFDGSRKITRVTEVQGMEQQTIVMQDVFVFKQTGVEGGHVAGRLLPAGIRPKFLEKLEQYNVHVSPALFQPVLDPSRPPAMRRAE